MGRFRQLLLLVLVFRHAISHPSPSNISSTMLVEPVTSTSSAVEHGIPTLRNSTKPGTSTLIYASTLEPEESTPTSTVTEESSSTLESTTPMAFANMTARMFSFDEESSGTEETIPNSSSKTLSPVKEASTSAPLLKDGKREILARWNGSDSRVDDDYDRRSSSSKKQLGFYVLLGFFIAFIIVLVMLIYVSIRKQKKKSPAPAAQSIPPEQDSPNLRKVPSNQYGVTLSHYADEAFTREHAPKDIPPEKFRYREKLMRHWGAPPSYRPELNEKSNSRTISLKIRESDCELIAPCDEIAVLRSMETQRSIEDRFDWSNKDDEGPPEEDVEALAARLTLKKKPRSARKASRSSRKSFKSLVNKYDPPTVGRIIKKKA